MGTKGYKQHKWSRSDYDYLIDNFQSRTCAELAAHLGVSENALKDKRRKLGLVKSEDALKKIYSRSNPGQFTAGRSPRNTLTDHAITVRKERGQSFQWIRLELAVWQQLHHYVWLKAGREIPAGRVLVFKDGDTMNCDLDNLELITRAQNLQRNSLRKGHREELILQVKAEREKNLQERLAKASKTGRQRILKREQDKADRLEAKRSAKEQRAAELSVKRSAFMSDSKFQELRLAKLAEKMAAGAEQKKSDQQAKAERKLETTLRKAARISDKQDRAEARLLAVKLDIAERALKKVTKQLNKTAAPKQDTVQLKVLSDKAKARELKQLAKAKIKAKRQHDERRKAADQQKPLPTKVFNPGELVPLRIDHRTVIYIKPDRDPAEAKAHYLAKRNPPADKYAELPPVYQF